VELQEEAQVLPRGQPVVEPGLLGEEPHPRAELLAVAVERNAAHRGPARRGAEQPGEHPDGGGLPRPVRPEQPEDLSGGDVEVEPLHRGAVTELLGEGTSMRLNRW
jgi:hypothetical protein